MTSVAATPNPVSSDRTPPSRWAAVGVIAFGTFLVVTAEMLPVGVLTPMAADLGIATGAAGASLTVTGLVSAVTAPLAPRLLGDLDRRVVLAAAMVVLAVGNALTAAAGDVTALMIARVILGVGMGTVWGLAAAVTQRLVAVRDAGLAVALALSGIAAASVAGVPLGTFAGDAFGWRASFGGLAVLAVVAAAALLVALPTLRRPVSPAGPAARGRLLRPAVVTGLVLIAALVTAHFAAYTYVRPALEERAGLSATAIGALLLLYGVFGLAGNFAAGAVAARRPRATVLALAAGIAAAIAALAWFGTAAAAVGAVIALWGAVYGGLSVAGQLWMTAAAAPDRSEQVTGLYVGVFTGAIALGAFVGGVVVEGAGPAALLWSAAALAAASLLAGLCGPGPRAGR